MKASNCKLFTTDYVSTVRAIKRRIRHGEMVVNGGKDLKGRDRGLFHCPIPRFLRKTTRK